tara:strand:+ start:2303 stop:3556 length:1254 start_codon:yes stop_codon:yes gene_type:complete
LDNFGKKIIYNFIKYKFFILTVFVYLLHLLCSLTYIIIYGETSYLVVSFTIIYSGILSFFEGFRNLIVVTCANSTKNTLSQLEKSIQSIYFLGGIFSPFIYLLVIEISDLGYSINPILILLLNITTLYFYYSQWRMSLSDYKGNTSRNMFIKALPNLILLCSCLILKKYEFDLSLNKVVSFYSLICFFIYFYFNFIDGHKSNFFRWMFAYRLTNPLKNKPVINQIKLSIINYAVTYTDKFSAVLFLNEIKLASYFAFIDIFGKILIVGRMASWLLLPNLIDNSVKYLKYFKIFIFSSIILFSFIMAFYLFFLKFENKFFINNVSLYTIWDKIILISIFINILGYISVSILNSNNDFTTQVKNYSKSIIYCLALIFIIYINIYFNIYNGFNLLLIVSICFLLIRTADIKFILLASKYN